MLIERLNVDFTFHDDRGTLVQLVRRGYSQINCITSRNGTFRGGHYHKMNTEAFYVVCGKCRVTAKRDGVMEIEEFVAGDFFRIGPYTVHDFDYIEDTVLISMYSLGVELEDKKFDSYTIQIENAEKPWD